jgi:transcription antitermination factor NusG
MTATAIDLNLGRHAVALARQQWGPQALQPIGPYLTALMPLVPECERQRRWHVVQTHSQQEATVENELAKLKLDAYCPREPKRVRVNACKHRTVKRPILVGYVFAGFDPELEHWEAIRGLRGVMRLMMWAERPIPIGEAEMARIQYIEQDRAGGRVAKLAPIELQVDVLVRILDPLSFAGLIGFITEVDHEKRQVHVEIEIFKRMVPLWLNPEQVEVV